MRQTYERCSFTFTDILDKWKLQPAQIDELFEIHMELFEETKDLLQEILDQICSKYSMPPFILPVGNCKLIKTNNWLAS